MALQPQLRTELRSLPGVLQTLGMLTLTHGEVVEATELALAENPVLERAEGHPCPGCGRHVTQGVCRRCRSGGAIREAGPESELSVDPFTSIEADAALEIRSDCRHALAPVLAHLTPRGLLDADPAEIAELHRIEVAAIEEALRALRAVGPPGIGAPDVVSLLEAQAQALVVEQQAPAWLPHLVRHHLADLAEGRTQEVALMMNLPAVEVQEALVIIRARLRPFVLFEQNEMETAVRTADVLLYRQPDGSLDVEVPSSAWFGLTVVDLAAGLGEAGGTEEAKQWLAEHEQSARRLISQLDGRADVLRRVALAAVSHQQEFLSHGPAFHRALTRTAVAQEIGIHPSTVSRAVGSKRLRLPSGEVVDLSCLFGKSVAARAAVEQLISEGTGSRSDAGLRDVLARQGVDIARRTVTKYRHGIAGSDAGGQVKGPSVTN